MTRGEKPDFKKYQRAADDHATYVDPEFQNEVSEPSKSKMEEPEIDVPDQGRERG
ncbi:hypothetical protein NLX83_15475 [Allokutzneria sp. A3M-2-11 16]|nr:hypothetical protein [Allokutzneria sp. A3M-2-11 16]